MAWTHTFAFRCFREQFIDTYNQQNGADSGLSGGSGNDRFTNTISPVKNLVSTILKDCLRSFRFPDSCRSTVMVRGAPLLARPA